MRAGAGQHGISEFFDTDESILGSIAKVFSSSGPMLSKAGDGTSRYSPGQMVVFDEGARTNFTDEEILDLDELSP